MAVHETNPPEEQRLKTDPTSILITSLMARRGKNPSKDAQKEQQQKKKREEKGKRPAEGDPSSGEEPQSKRSHGVGSDEASGSGTKQYTKNELENMTVKQLQLVLQQKGLPVSGRKDVLVQRVLDT